MNRVQFCIKILKFGYKFIFLSGTLRALQYFNVVRTYMLAYVHHIRMCMHPLVPVVIGLYMTQLLNSFSGYYKIPEVHNFLPRIIYVRTYVHRCGSAVTACFGILACMYVYMYVPAHSSKRLNS